MDDLSKVIQNGDQEFDDIESLEEQLPMGIIRQGTTEESTQDDPINLDDDTDEESIKISSLSSWFKENHERFDNINHVKLSVKGVDPDETLVFSILDPKGGMDDRGFPKRYLTLFENANNFPVLDLPGVSMEIFTNCFIIVYDLGNANFLKCYGVKSGLNVYQCINVSGTLVPHTLIKMKKNSKEFKMVDIETNNILTNLSSSLDKELLILQYPQIRKFIEDISTKNNAIDWFIERRKNIIEMGHLMKIENAILHLTTYGG